MTQRVIIVGAGPVGLIAALALGREGVPVTVFEREAELTKTLRGSTFHPPTLDMLDPFGLTEALIQNGLVARKWQIRDRRAGPVATFDMGALSGDTRHPYRVQCEQWKLSEFVVEALTGLPSVELVFGEEVKSVSQDADRVVVNTEGCRGARSATGRFAIAADGAGSTLRRAMGIEFEGFTYPERFLVVSTPFDFAEHWPDLTPINYVSDPHEWLVLLQVPGLWRVLFPTSPDTPPEEILDASEIQGRLHSVHWRDVSYEVTHQTLYPIHQRVARNYRSGRVFLIGDAAHVNNPLGGMGLNGGIHDALCLTERLNRVLGGDDETLLDQYERKRRPIALDYVKQATMRNQQLLEERYPSKREASLADLRASAEDPQRAREVMLRASMIAAVRRADAIV